MADIFLSYAREDAERVRSIVSAFEAVGWSVWWDSRLQGGQQWDDVIERELAQAKCVVVVWSAISVNSRWVRSEATDGLDRRVLVPVTIDGTKPPLAFRLIQVLDLSGWDGDFGNASLQSLLVAVAKTFLDPDKELKKIAEVPQRRSNMAGDRIAETRIPIPEEKRSVWSYVLSAILVVAAVSVLFASIFGVHRPIAAPIEFALSSRLAKFRRSRGLMVSASIGTSNSWRFRRVNLSWGAR